MAEIQYHSFQELLGRFPDDIRYTLNRLFIEIADVSLVQVWWDDGFKKPRLRLAIAYAPDDGFPAMTMNSYLSPEILTDALWLEVVVREQLIQGRKSLIAKEDI